MYPGSLYQSGSQGFYIVKDMKPQLTLTLSVTIFFAIYLACIDNVNTK